MSNIAHTISLMNKIFNNWFLPASSAGVSFAIIFYSSIAQAITFTLNPTFDTSTTEGALALAGFEQAANRWSNLFSDDINVNLDIGFESLSQGVLGGARANSRAYSIAQVANSLRADITSTNDQIAFNNLPLINYRVNNRDITGIAFRGTEENNTIELDPFSSGILSFDNILLSISQANAKALGLINDNGSADANITFSSDFTFDFNPNDGIDAGAFDFVGVATHEIGHALGFLSGVDFRIGTRTDLDNFAVFNPLDLYRYSEESLALGSNQGIPILDLATGGNPFFSIDGGANNLGFFSTGEFNGDGRQASHWKDNQGLGIMDPTFLIWI